MRRDMELVRQLLLKIEAADRGLDLTDFTCDAWTNDEIAYHLRLLKSKGFIDGTEGKAWSGNIVMFHVDGLTWDGADFLDAIRDDRVFSKTSKVVRETVGSVTLDTFKDAAKIVALEAIKRGIGL